MGCLVIELVLFNTLILTDHLNLIVADVDHLVIGTTVNKHDTLLLNLVVLVKFFLVQFLAIKETDWFVLPSGDSIEVLVCFGLQTFGFKKGRGWVAESRLELA